MGSGNMPMNNQFFSYWFFGRESSSSERKMQVWNGSHNSQWARLERHMESCLLQPSSSRNERMLERQAPSPIG